MFAAKLFSKLAQNYSMKLLFIIMFCLLSAYSNAQTNKQELSQKQADAHLKNYRLNQPVMIMRDTLFSIMNKNLLASGKKPGIYLLKDGMPCLVPDTKDIAAIPNVWKGQVGTFYQSNEPQIPNPIKPNAQLDTK